MFCKYSWQTYYIVSMKTHTNKKITSASKVFLIILLFFILLSLTATFYKLVILKDFEIINEAESTERVS